MEDSLFINYPKQRCVVCNKKFYPKFCKICKNYDFISCRADHENSTYHKRRVSMRYA